MKKDDFRRWMEDYLVTQRRLVMGSVAGMATIGAIATLMEFGAILLIAKVGFFSSWFLCALMALGVLAAAQFVTWLRMPKELGDVVQEVAMDEGSVTVRIPLGLPVAWTYGFGSMDTDQSRIELMLNLLTIPQRMCCAAWFAWQRFQELKTVDAATIASIIRLLHKKAERVGVKELADELDLRDVPTAIRQVSLIDGVVMLSRGEPGLSLANRLTDALADWKTKQPSTREG